MAMSGKGLSKDAFSLCSLKGQKQQNSFQRMKKIISFLSFILFAVLSTSLDSYGQNNLEDLFVFIISSWQLCNSLYLPYSFPLLFCCSLIIYLYSPGLTTVSTVTEISRSCVSLLPTCIMLSQLIICLQDIREIWNYNIQMHGWMNEGEYAEPKSYHLNVGYQQQKMALSNAWIPTKGNKIHRMCDVRGITY